MTNYRHLRRPIARLFDASVVVSKDHARPARLEGTQAEFAWPNGLIHPNFGRDQCNSSRGGAEAAASSVSPVGEVAMISICRLTKQSAVGDVLDDSF